MSLTPMHDPRHNADQRDFLKFKPVKRKGYLALAVADIWAKIADHHQQWAVAKTAEDSDMHTTLPINAAQPGAQPVADQSAVADQPAVADPVIMVEGAPPVSSQPETTDTALTLDEIMADPAKTAEHIRKLSLLIELHNLEAARGKKDVVAAALKAAETEVRTANLVRQRADEELLWSRAHNRPSLILDPTLTHEDGRWCATYGVFQAYGETPDLAFDNFDFHWING